MMILNKNFEQKIRIIAFTPKKWYKLNAFFTAILSINNNSNKMNSIQKSILFLTLVTVALSSPAPELGVAKRIANGTEADIDDWPFVVCSNRYANLTISQIKCTKI